MRFHCGYRLVSAAASKPINCPSHLETGLQGAKACECAVTANKFVVIQQQRCRSWSVTGQRGSSKGAAAARMGSAFCGSAGKAINTFGLKPSSVAKSGSASLCPEGTNSAAQGGLAGPWPRHRAHPSPWARETWTSLPRPPPTITRSSNPERTFIGTQIDCFQARRRKSR